MTRLMGAGMLRSARRAAAFLLAPSLLVVLAGCSDATDQEQEVPAANPLLYEIASNDGTVEGWMIGTIHALPSGTPWRTPAIAAAVDEADLLLVEIATLDDRTKLASTFTALGKSPGLPTIDRRVPAALRSALNNLLNRGGISARSVSGLETWAAAITLAQVDAEGDPASGVDRALIRDFADRPVRELEGVQTQLSIFDRLSERDQRDLLAAVISEADAAQADTGKLRRAWLAGDIAVLEEATRTGILADPELHEALLVERNHKWLQAILPVMKDKPRPLIAVGTAHLVGPEGLATLLEQQGYRIRRLP